MKKITLTLAALIMAATSLMGQAKKPTLMVVPSDQLCNDLGYMQKMEHDGVTDYAADYNRALLDGQIMSVITRINSLMADRGFPLKDLSQSLKSINQNATEDKLINSKSGVEMVESPLDKLRRTAKADIVMEVGWTVTKTGPKTTVSYSLRGVDAYTGKQVAGAQGTGNPSLSSDVAQLLQEAVITNIDVFNAQLQDHFDDLLNNGREVVIDVRVFDNAEGIDLDKEYGVEKLRTLDEIIEDWLYENTVQHRFSKADGTENFALFEQVRIPLYKANGQAMDTEAFVRELHRHLQAEYKIPSKVVNRGLGRCLLIIGDK